MTPPLDLPKGYRQFNNPALKALCHTHGLEPPKVLRDKAALFKRLEAKVQQDKAAAQCQAVPVEQNQASRLPSASSSPASNDASCPFREGFSPPVPGPSRVNCDNNQRAQEENFGHSSAAPVAAVVLSGGPQQRMNAQQAVITWQQQNNEHRQEQQEAPSVGQEPQPNVSVPQQQQLQSSSSSSSSNAAHDPFEFTIGRDGGSYREVEVCVRNGGFRIRLTPHTPFVLFSHPQANSSPMFGAVDTVAATPASGNRQV